MGGTTSFNSNNADQPPRYGKLNDTELEAELKKNLIVHPILSKKQQVHGTKIDLRLDNIIYTTKNTIKPYYDPKNDDESDYREKIVLPYDKPFIIHPNELLLAPLFETISVPNYMVGDLQGRSSLGRLGIIVHITAPIVDPGFSGIILLELSNLGNFPVALYPLMRVAAISFEYIPQPKTPYSAQEGHKYQHDIEGASSKLSKDIDLEIISKIDDKSIEKFKKLMAEASS